MSERKLRIKLSDVCRVLGVECEYEDRDITKIAHIRRNIQEGCIYFAFKNWRVDTYANVELAIKKKAAIIVTEKYIGDYPCIVVKDSLKAFMELVHWYRQQLSLEIIGVTGSVGKTSTKEMIYSVLQEDEFHNTEKNAENANSLDLAAMNLFDIKKDTDVIVQEMAIQNLRESSVAINPTYAVVTNIGVSHVEEFGSRENIFRNKMRIMDGMHGGKVFLNGDDDMLWNYVKNDGVTAITYALDNENADCRAINLRQNESGYDFEICYEGECISAATNCPGKHNVLNALVAYAIGKDLGMKEDSIVRGIASYRPTGYRQNVFQINNHTILADCFNAAPQSMKAALDTLESMPSSKMKVAVLADMLELGEYSHDFHQEVGAYVNEKNIQHVVCYGIESKYISAGITNPDIEVRHTVYEHELLKIIKEHLREDCTILFKGSHGMMLEEVIDEVFGTDLTNPRDKDKYIWDQVEREGYDVKKYLSNRGYKKVAIYGLTTNGENMIQFFEKAGIEICCAIDSRVKYAPHTLYKCPVYTLDEELPRSMWCLFLITVIRRISLQALKLNWMLIVFHMQK